MGNTHGIIVKRIWEYPIRTLTSAVNITSDGDPIDQSKIANLDATISSRMSNQYEDKLPNLDRLDVNVSSRMSNQYENKLVNLDNLDVAVSTRSNHSVADVWSYSTRTLTSLVSLAERSDDNIIFKQYKKYYYHFTEANVFKTLYKVKIYLKGNIVVYLKCNSIDITVDWELRHNGTTVDSWTTVSSTNYTERTKAIKGVDTGDILEVVGKARSVYGASSANVIEFTIYGYKCFTEILPCDANEV